MGQELYNSLDFVNSDHFGQYETIMSEIFIGGTELRNFCVLKGYFNLKLSLDYDPHEMKVKFLFLVSDKCLVYLSNILIMQQHERFRTC